MMRTAFRKRPRRLHPRELRGPKLDYGPDWDRKAARARRVDRHTCQVCGHQNRKGEPRLPVHHLIPLRLFGAESAESASKAGGSHGTKPGGPNDDANRQSNAGQAILAHALANLLCVCRACHPKLLPGETKLLRGDILGAWVAYREAGVPLDRLAAAFRHAGLPEVR